MQVHNPSNRETKEEIGKEEDATGVSNDFARKGGGREAARIPPEQTYRSASDW